MLCTEVGLSHTTISKEDLKKLTFREFCGDLQRKNVPVPRFFMKVTARSTGCDNVLWGTQRRDARRAEQGTQSNKLARVVEAKIYLDSLPIPHNFAW